MKINSYDIEFIIIYKLYGFKLLNHTLKELISATMAVPITNPSSVAGNAYLIITRASIIDGASNNNLALIAGIYWLNIIRSI
jgi:hypothetical protein